MSENKRGVAILGSTGSIGCQALEVIRQHSDHLGASVLTANKNADRLIEQALEFKPNTVVIVDKDQYKYVQEKLFPAGIKVFAGMDSLEQIVALDEVDIVLTALVGFAGLKSTIKAVQNAKPVALANKETLVVAGEYITHLAREFNVNIFPVDSEHSAIFQCLAGEGNNAIEKIFLTASGGPFRDKSREEIQNATKHQALKHPNWEMGQKITIDSATLMNKGLEVIEAKWLFGLRDDQIDVLIHPQSIVHSMVQFQDGAVKAELGPPDMRVPIQYALSCPKRLPSNFERLELKHLSNLTFQEPDLARFPNLGLAYDAMRAGGNVPCILNAANEVAVDAFLKEKIKFPEISSIIDKSMNKLGKVSKPSLQDYIDSDNEARAIAQNLIP